MKHRYLHLLLLSVLSISNYCHAQSLSYDDAESAPGAVGMMKVTLRVARLFREKCVLKFPELSDSIDRDLSIWEKKESTILRFVDDRWPEIVTREPRLAEVASASVLMAGELLERLEKLPAPTGEELMNEKCSKHFSNLASGVWRSRTPNAYQFLDAWAAKPTTRARPIPSSGNYSNDFTDLYLIAQSVKWMRDTCSEAYPDQRTRNDGVYAQWHAKNSDILEELDSRLAQSSARSTRSGVAPKLSRLLPKAKEDAREDLIAQGRLRLFETCDSYPAFLRSDRTDLPYFFSNYIATIRKGPPNQ